MNKKHSLSFLLEHIMIIGIFAIASTICVNIFTMVYKKNEIANKSKEAIEVISSYIENNDYQNKSFIENEIEYIVTDNKIDFDHYQITAIFEGKELFTVEFYGDSHE